MDLLQFIQVDTISHALVVLPQLVDGSHNIVLTENSMVNM